MKITVFGGAGEVGGNQILLEGSRSRLFLDFGRNFSREDLYFDQPFLSPREPKQRVELGLLPHLPGLYRWEEGEPPVSGILLSHAHLDHMDCVRYVNEKIPIWAGDGTWRVFLAREVTSRKSEEERVARFERRGENFFRCVSPTRDPLHNFRTDREFEVGEFRVRPVHVDHSVVGSYGFVLQGPEGSLAYTGDLRFHGYRQGLSEDFVKAAGGCEVLITEGTNLPEFRPSSEKEVGDKAKRIVSEARGLVVASSSTVDADRIRTFYRVAQDNGRELVLSMRQAALMEMLRGEIEEECISFPFKLGDQGVKIYLRKKERYEEWEKELQEEFGSLLVDSSSVSQNQERFLLSFTYYDMLELLRIKPKEGSVFLYSESEPWNEEGEIEFQKLLNWLELLGLPLFHVHASGHAGPADLRRMVEEISPRKIVVVHSERPELLRRFLGRGLGERVVCPRRGEPIDLSRG